MTGLSIIAIGHVHAESVLALTKELSPVEQLVLDVHPRADLVQHRAELHRAIDAASNDWILIVREREEAGDALAKEVAAAAVGNARAWGYRIRTQALYAGNPLRLGDTAGELRLFHRRHFLRRGGDLNVQGTVVRLHEPLTAVTFATVEEHRQYLEQNGIPHSTLRRALLFLRNALGSRTSDRNTLRYLWIEAGFDQG
ncbi:MAG: hypothetical protein JWO56_1939 [Acidobacteria bacterium]|nr:hypothetical protein [Acidobacteriota bacterium]